MGHGGGGGGGVGVCVCMREFVNEYPCLKLRVCVSVHALVGLCVCL